VQIDPNTPPQAPVADGTLCEDLHAPAPVAAGRRNKKGRKSAKPRQNKIADLADVDVAERVADGASSAVIEGTDLDAVVRRLRSGAYNTREVAEVIARRLLASGDL
jgi:hypothetical protein